MAFFLKGHDMSEGTAHSAEVKFNCTACGGSGKVRDTQYDDPDPGSGYRRMMAQLAQVFPQEKTCPACGGSGVAA